MTSPKELPELKPERTDKSGDPALAWVITAALLVYMVVLWLGWDTQPTLMLGRIRELEQRVEQLEARK